MRQISTVNTKTADMISHACRLSYQLYILSNRIVKPNNRYTRQPASHDFLFYSVSDKSYVLTAQTALLCDLQCVQPRRIIILRIAPTMPKAELEAAHSRRRNLERLTAAKTAVTFYPCLPSYFYQYHAVKPHCKAK